MRRLATSWRRVREPAGAFSGRGYNTGRRDKRFSDLQRITYWQSTSRRRASTWSSSRSVCGTCWTSISSICCSALSARNSCRATTARLRSPISRFRSRMRTNVDAEDGGARAAGARARVRRRGARGGHGQRILHRAPREPAADGNQRRGGAAARRRSAAKSCASPKLPRNALVVGDAARGYGDALYDVIVLTGSTPIVPEGFVQQLKPGGRLFAVVGDPPA